MLTVSGNAGGGDLGVVAMHERVLFGLPGWESDPWVSFDRPMAFDSIVSALVEFKEAGGGALVDAGGTFGGRDPEMLANLERASGVKIVASSGLGAERALPGYFLFPLAEGAQGAKNGQPGAGANWTPDPACIASMILGELESGMAGSGMIRTKVRAGIVTAAGSPETVREIEEFAIRGAAIAAKKAGAAVFVDSAAQARRVFELLSAEGLSPDRIVIGHCDDARAADANRDRQFAERGCCVAYDHVGWEEGSPHAMPDERRVAMVKDMVAAGFAGRVVLSCSAIGWGLGVRRTEHRFARLLKDFVPRLKKAGVSEQAIHAMLAENPRRILAGPNE